MHAPLPSTFGPEGAAGSAGSAAHEHTAAHVAASTAAPETLFADPFADRAVDTRIGQLLQQAGKLTAENAERVARTQQELGLRFGAAAMRLGLVNQEDVDAAIARQFAYPLAARGDSALSAKLVAAYEPAGIQGDTLRAVRSQLLLR